MLWPIHSPLQVRRCAPPPERLPVHAGRRGWPARSQVRSQAGSWRTAVHCDRRGRFGVSRGVQVTWASRFSLLFSFFFSALPPHPFYGCFSPIATPFASPCTIGGSPFSFTREVDIAVHCRQSVSGGGTSHPKKTPPKKKRKKGCPSCPSRVVPATREF